MSGVASLFGGSSTKQDRAAELNSRNTLANSFDYLLPQGQQSTSTGNAFSADAGNYFGNLLRAGRTQTAEQAAPAINANLSADDARRRREALTGTGRTGGTAEADRFAGEETDAKNADIINQTMQQNKAIGAQGEASVGKDFQGEALGQLGLGGQQVENYLGNTLAAQGQDAGIRAELYGYGNRAGTSSTGGLGADAGNILANLFL
jgi:hypothetical protein